MQTIEEAAKECSLNEFNNGNQLSSEFDYGFQKGVEFAQRWVQVEEEPPTKGIEVIAKNKHRKVVYEVKTNDDVKYICENFTSWRPVALK